MNKYVVVGTYPNGNKRAFVVIAENTNTAIRNLLAEVNENFINMEVIDTYGNLTAIGMASFSATNYYREQFEILVNAINEAKAADSGYFTVKQMENTKNKVKAKLDSLYKDGRKDDVITFEQLGVDKIFVDESHNYKNLHLYTKMRNVAGISQTEAQKSADMFMKCRYLDEETGSKGVVFATGTPISNSLTEMYTVQRYLQYETLQSLGLEHFDQWASIFTEPTSDMELAPEGGGYRMRTRCAKFQNLPDGICFRGCLKSNTTKTYDNRPSVAIRARLLRCM